MPHLRSIAPIAKVIDTNQKPVLVFCEDLEYYVCKHNHGQRPAYALFCEWLAWHLLQQLEVSVAPFREVAVLNEHVIPSSGCQPAFFLEKTCFATLQLTDSVEITQFSFAKKELTRIRNVADLMKIAFLDVLLANEDRHESNYNLLLQSTEEGYFIVPIDHENRLNSHSFREDRPLYSEDYNYTLISSDFFKAALSGKVKNLAEVEQLFEEYYLCTKTFVEQLHEKALTLPADWRIPANYIRSLQTNLLHPDWLHETKTNYLSFIRTSLNIT